MRISIKLIISLVIIVASVAGFSAYLQIRQEKERLDLEIRDRSRILAESLHGTVEDLLERRAVSRIEKIFKKFDARENVEGIALYNEKGQPKIITPELAVFLDSSPRTVQDSFDAFSGKGNFEILKKKRLYVYALPLGTMEDKRGVLSFFHSTEYTRVHYTRIILHNFFKFLIQTILISFVILIMLRWGLSMPIERMAKWMKRLQSGDADEDYVLPHGDLFAPITKEISTFASHLLDARAAAEEEAKLREEGQALWTPDRLKENVRNSLEGKPLIVISNREPYQHRKKGRDIECVVPAGGLVSALDPVLKATDGLWIAHGSGDADWDVVDKKNRIRVPPAEKLYTLKRVALTKEEEEGYYFGFSNEGLWPLCHMVHSRPYFKSMDWAHYQKVNLKFAQATLDEIENVEEPCVLIQDYHFALLPRMIKKKRPDARVALFWHIPWPNPESFSICPWQKDILNGMLGADLLGFHIQFHCNNFLETVDRSVESRIDWEHFSVTKGGHTTLVKPFPISVAFPSASLNGNSHSHEENPTKEDLLKKWGVKAKHMAIAVDRVDYTKGIPERLQAVEQFLEKYPAYKGEFTLIQIGAPSRTHIKRYYDLMSEVEDETDRINKRFQTSSWKPIVYIKEHYNHKEIIPYYKQADLCLVTSLHDGMNLVAKEFVAAREDENGALILSRFAGASQELRDALIINPYDADRVAEAIYYALNMTPKETKKRMVKMRDTLQDHNIYRWAGNLIDQLIRVRIDR